METPRVRVWAEERAAGLLHLTWEVPEDAGERDSAANRRAVAAALHVRQRVESAKPDEDGVLVRFDPEALEKAEIAAFVRAALDLEGDLKSRSNELVRRVPTYLNLAQRLARDERVSPLPDAARNMRYQRGMPRAALPLSMIPGFRLVSRLHMVLPALQSLASWSREAPPEVVEHHLSSAGLSREQLDLDHATAQEMMFYARDVSAEKAVQIGRKAGELTSQASILGKQWMAKAREKRDAMIEPDDEKR